MTFSNRDISWNAWNCYWGSSIGDKGIKLELLEDNEVPQEATKCK